jgi:hypothetical protein
MNPHFPTESHGETMKFRKGRRRSSEVQGWDLAHAFVREKLIADSVKLSGHQSRPWVLLSCVLMTGFVAFSVIRVGRYGLVVVPLALVGLLALLRANTAGAPVG